MGTIGKALTLLNHLSLTRPEIGLSDFARLSGGDKATTLRHLAALAEAGFLEQDRRTKLYRVGPAVLRLAALRERATPVRSAAAPILEALSARAGELAHASLLEGDALAPLAHAEPRAHGLRVSYDPTEMLPLHATASGLAVLAFGAEALRRRVTAGRLPAFTDATVTVPAGLADLIAETRRRGHAVSDGLYEDDVFSLALPLFDEEGRATGAVAVAMPRARATADRRADALAALGEAAAALTAALGGATPDDIAALWRAAS